MSALEDGLRAALTDAMRARDKVAVGALRSVLGVVANAEAVPLEDAGAAGAGPAPGTADESRIAGASAGVGATEAVRRELTDGDVEALVRAEIADRRSSAAEYRGYGQAEHADRLDAEADVLDAQLG